MKSVYEMALIDHTHWSHLNLWQKNTNNQILMHLQIKSPHSQQQTVFCSTLYAHILFSSILYSILLVCEELSRLMNNHATSALHMQTVVSFAFHLLFTCVAWCIKRIIYRENKLSTDCPAEITSSCTITACILLEMMDTHRCDWSSPTKFFLISSSCRFFRQVEPLALNHTWVWNQGVNETRR